jgi:RND family efflux transporter MFP subunit
VVVKAPERRAVKRTLRLPASIEALEQTTVRARVEGYLVRMEADVGDRLEAGRLVAVIDAPELAVDARVLDRRVALAEAAVITAKKQRRVLELARASLSKLGRGVVPGREVDGAAARVDAADARIAQAAAEVRLMGAQRERITVDLGFLEVRAPPYPSVVLARRADRGALVGPGHAEGALLTLVRSDRVRAVVHVPESEARLVSKATGVTLHRPEGGGGPLTAGITRLAGALDPATRTLRVEIELDGETVAVGHYFRATLALEARDGARVVPGRAVTLDEERQPSVLVVEDGVVVSKAITTGIDDGALVEVTAGLAPDAQVITSGRAGIRAGTRVEAVTATGD